MNNLKEKPREEVYPSTLSYPVGENTVTLSNYLDRSGNVNLTDFRSNRSFEYEPLPPMFRRQRHQDVAVSGPNSVDPANADAGVPVGAPSEADPSIETSGGLSPYIAAALFLALMAGAAVHFTTTAEGDRDAIAQPATADRGAIATAAFFSSPSHYGSESAQPQTLTPTQPSLADRETWSETVETFKRLLAEQKASQASALKQADNERLLGQFEAWMNAKAR
jgi:hypothetical protein